jgi:sugar phosphate isomerase/epimerase
MATSIFLILNFLLIMQLNRRDFLKISSLLTAGSIVGCDTLQQTAMEATNGIKNFGLQLYTLRDEMPKAPKEVLKQVASFGYKQIESYEGKSGMFWGMTHKEFKSYLDGLGMKAVSSHCDFNKDMEKKAAEAAEIGMKYLIAPWVGPQASMDDWKKITDRFNAAAAICKKNGIRFAYHNHDYSFKELEGQIPQDYLMANSNPDAMDFEMDMYWVVNAGIDPIAYLKKHPNRFRLCHIKDRIKAPKEDGKFESCDLGTGSINWASLLKTAKDTGMQYFIVEQEAYTGSTPLKSTQADGAYMKKLVIG